MYIASTKVAKLRIWSLSAHMHTYRHALIWDGPLFPTFASSMNKTNLLWYRHAHTRRCTLRAHGLPTVAANPILDTNISCDIHKYTHAFMQVYATGSWRTLRSLPINSISPAENDAVGVGEEEADKRCVCMMCDIYAWVFMCVLAWKYPCGEEEASKWFWVRVYLGMHVSFVYRNACVWVYERSML